MGRHRNPTGVSFVHVRARPLVAELVVVAMVSGCATFQQSKKTAISGGITIGASLVLAVAGLAIAAASTNSGASFSCGSSSLCPVASVVGLAGVVGVPIGAVITAGGLLGMVGYRDRDSDPSPQVPLQVDDRFWCQRDSGICTNDQGSCGPDCLSTKSIWCAPYKTVDGEPGLLCGLSGDVCLVLAISGHNRRGRESFGECEQRTEPLPPTRPGMR